eukprot:11086612-Lingulodinium_polyedra.AAC.1
MGSHGSSSLLQETTSARPAGAAAVLSSAASALLRSLEMRVPGGRWRLRTPPAAKSAGLLAASR